MFFLQSVKKAQFQHFFLKIAPVQTSVKNGFIECLKILHGEFFRQQGEPNGQMIDLNPNLIKGFLYDLIVIKKKLGQCMEITLIIM